MLTGLFPEMNFLLPNVQKPVIMFTGKELQRNIIAIGDIGKQDYKVIYLQILSIVP